MSDDLLKLAAVLAPVMAKLDTKIDAPGHMHQTPGVWDADISNGERAGNPCEWCAQWAELRALYERARSAA